MKLSRLARGSRNLTAVATILVLLASTGCQREETVAPEPVIRPIRTITLTAATEDFERSFPGKIKPTQQVDLSFRISGPLIDFPVREGQRVEANALIARIDPRDYETDLANAQSALSEAQARLDAMRTGARPEEVRVLEADVRAALAKYQEADQQYKRIQNLYAQKSATRVDLDEAKRTRDVTQAQLEVASENLKKGQSGAREEDIRAMEATIAGLEAKVSRANDALNDTYLRAPFAGLVARKYVENYQDVQAKQAIVNLQDMTHLDIVIQVPESGVLAARRTREYTALAVFDGLPGKTFPLEFKEISAKPDPQTNTYGLTMTMPYPEGEYVLSGMTVQVVVRASEAADADKPRFLVPMGAVFTDADGKPSLFLFDRGSATVHRVPVEAGTLSGASMAVTGDIKAGDVIVTAGVHFLREGQKVRLLEDAGEKQP